MERKPPKSSTAPRSLVITIHLPPIGSAAISRWVADDDLREELATEQDHWCGDCGVLDGELHLLGCCLERCPWCGGQLITCDCAFEQLRIRRRRNLTPEEEARWVDKVEVYGRVPFIHFVSPCCRCAAIKPERYDRAEEDWSKYIPLAQRDCVICKLCFQRIKHVIDSRRGGLKPIS